MIPHWPDSRLNKFKSEHSDYKLAISLTTIVRILRNEKYYLVKCEVCRHVISGDELDNMYYAYKELVQLVETCREKYIVGGTHVRDSFGNPVECLDPNQNP